MKYGALSPLSFINCDMNMKRFALADCNNFFVSCERVFDPKLNGKPVVILSSNDACVIARSNEAKKIGIKMGQPAWECRDIFKQHRVIVYSSNFTLYGDLSKRVMQVLTHYSTEIEIYSIDEAFFLMPPSAPTAGISSDALYYTRYAHFVRQHVKKQVGIPISIGIGPTKTLAKIANGIAKKNPEGVFDITHHPHIDDILKSINVADIWGIGYRYSKKLYARGITTAYDFKNCDEKWVRKNFTINGLRTLLELKGVECLDLQQPDPKQSITVSRLFGRNVTELTELKEGLATHTITAAEKLRKQSMCAQQIIVFTCFISYHDNTRHYNSCQFQLPIATSYTPTLLWAATVCLEKLFKKGSIYKKVGIILDDFVPADTIQMNGFAPFPHNSEKQIRLMQTIDTINSKLGKNKVSYAVAGTTQSWKNKQEKKTPAYTTNWHEILTIKI